MKVRATQLGYYDHRRRKPGEVFELIEVKGFTKDPKTEKVSPLTLSPEQQFSENWMEKVDESTPVGQAPETEDGAREPAPLSGAGKKKPAAKKSTGDADVI